MNVRVILLWHTTQKYAKVFSSQIQQTIFLSLLERRTYPFKRKFLHVEKTFANATNLLYSVVNVVQCRIELQAYKTAFDKPVCRQTGSG